MADRTTSAMTSGSKISVQHVALASIEVEGFKSIASPTRVDIRPVTVLAGSNSAGKSSIIQPLLLIKQTLEAQYDPGRLKLHGPNCRFTSADQVLTRRPGEAAQQRFAVTLKTRGEAGLRLEYKHVRNAGLMLDKQVASWGNGVQDTLRVGMSSAEIKEQAPRLSADYSAIRGTKSLKVIAQSAMLGVAPEDSDTAIVGPSRYELDRTFLFRARRLIHVPGLRGNPERAYGVAATGRFFPGTFESYVASVIERWRSKSDSRVKELGTDLEVLGLTWKIASSRVDDTSLELRVGRLVKPTQGGAKDLVSIADVGFGVSQTLPVLVALLVAEPGEIVFIEQPEIHLHPRAQARLAEIITKAAKRGVSVVVETHSTQLLLALRTLVAERTLPSSDTMLHWFSRGADGYTTVSRAQIDAIGAFGDWPEDFGDTLLETERRYLDAATKAAMRQQK